VTLVLDPPGPVAAPVVEPARARFTVRLENFTGPFDLLLQLIGRHEMDVTEVALHTVTDDFIAHTRELAATGDGAELDEISEFLLIAATLLDLKTARLLPGGDVEDAEDVALLEARDLLFARLLQYRAYKQVAGLFVELEAAAHRRFARSVSLEEPYASMLPEVTLGMDPDTFAGLAAAVFRPRPPTTVSLEHLHLPRVSVAEHMAVLRERLTTLRRASFHALSVDCESPLDLVARFLAVLELHREASVALEQAEAFGELIIRWTGP
jgi:segregation and condensation protein A